MTKSELTRAISDQKDWIRNCGATYEGYINRYGKKGAQNCYGDGADAIWWADMDALLSFEKEYIQRFAKNRRDFEEKFIKQAQLGNIFEGS